MPLNLKPDSRCLDFGCGTAIFAPVFLRSKLKYYGYDIDPQLLKYASFVYADAKFVSSHEGLREAAPYNLILANCCFHHIESEIMDRELEKLKNLLSDDGVFLMVDILLPANDDHLLRNLFRKLEKGAFIRTSDDYRKKIERHFSILDKKIERSHLFSIKDIPIYNDLLVLVCKKRQT